MRPEQYFDARQQLNQERSFTESCLPELVFLATKNKVALRESLANLPRQWPFADKVLVVVFPTFRDEVEAFHAGNGKSMTDMFETHQIASIDRGARITLNIKLTGKEPTD